MTVARENVLSIQEESKNLLAQQAELLKEIGSLLQNHPAGRNLSMLITPDEIEISEDEILVQKFDAERNVLSVFPKKIDELTLDEVIHKSQVHEIGNSNIEKFVNDTHMASCLKRHNSPGTIHVYD